MFTKLRGLTTFKVCYYVYHFMTVGMFVNIKMSFTMNVKTASLPLRLQKCVEILKKTQNKSAFFSRPTKICNQRLLFFRYLSFN